MPRNPTTSYRLDELTLKQLAELSDNLNTSKANVISRAIDRMYREQIRIPALLKYVEQGTLTTEQFRERLGMYQQEKTMSHNDNYLQLARIYADAAEDTHEKWYGDEAHDDQIIHANGVWSVGSQGDVDDYDTKSAATRALAESWRKQDDGNLYDAAARRVENDDDLNEYADIILADWPEGDEHWRWVCTEDANKILDWAQTIRKDELPA